MNIKLLIGFVLVFSLNAVSQTGVFPFGALIDDLRADLSNEPGIRLVIEYPAEIGLDYVITTKSYDLEGRLVSRIRIIAGEEIHSGKSRKYISKEQFDYNQDGQLIEIRGLDQIGNVKSVQKFRYDSEGELQEVRSSTSDNVTIERKVYSYDISKCTVDVTHEFYFEGKMRSAKKYRLKYSRGKLVSRVRLVSDGTSDSTTYSYNSSGLLTKVEFSGSFSYSYEYDYDLDRRGNWITRTGRLQYPGVENGDRRPRLSRRVIDYYR
ncbi:MAG: hypothetical protein OEQ39_26335 [Gammaproteobacteria bacterium]|nr:hypothetical protein [Gammaproteobacteria bacterium]